MPELQPTPPQAEAYTQPQLPWQYWSYRLFFWLLNLELEVEGQPNLDPSIFLGVPHQSHVDHLALLLAKGPHDFANLGIVFKGNHWFETWYYRRVVAHLAPPQSFPIDEDHPKEIIRLAQTINSRQPPVSLVIYPTGTRDISAKIKPGSFWLAEKLSDLNSPNHPNRPIQPVVIEYPDGNPLAKGEKIPLTLLKALNSFKLVRLSHALNPFLKDEASLPKRKVVVNFLASTTLAELANSNSPPEEVPEPGNNHKKLKSSQKYQQHVRNFEALLRQFYQNKNEELPKFLALE